MLPLKRIMFWYVLAVQLVFQWFKNILHMWPNEGGHISFTTCACADTTAATGAQRAQRWKHGSRAWHERNAGCSTGFFESSRSLGPTIPLQGRFTRKQTYNFATFLCWLGGCSNLFRVSAQPRTTNMFRGNPVVQWPASRRLFSLLNSYSQYIIRVCMGTSLSPWRKSMWNPGLRATRLRRATSLRYRVTHSPARFGTALSHVDVNATKPSLRISGCQKSPATSGPHM